MNSKIYRLADITKDNNKTVYYTFSITEDISKAKKGKLSGILLGEYRIEVDRKDWNDGHILYGNKALIYTLYAFVEVTIADFSYLEMCEHLQKNVAGFSRKELIEALEVTLSDFSDEEIINYLQDKYEGIAIAEITKWKLVDFSDDDFLQELQRRFFNHTETNFDKFVRSVHDVFYKVGYEAAKKEFEPKWISVQERLPVEEEKYLCKIIWTDDEWLEYRSKPHIYVIQFSNACSFATGEKVTHWMPLPEPPEQEKPEAPKYTCAQCGKECRGDLKDVVIQPIITNGVTETFYYCNRVCYEDKEWIPAEFPRDYGKECRARYQLGENSWKYNLILVGLSHIKSSYEFIIEMKGTDCKDTYSFCQVRRDSVNENNI